MTQVRGTGDRGQVEMTRVRGTGTGGDDMGQGDRWGGGDCGGQGDRWGGLWGTGGRGIGDRWAGRWGQVGGTVVGQERDRGMVGGQ